MARKKILIVDDNEVVLATLSMKLKANNYDIVTAKDGSEAMSAVRRERPNLILLDIGFPPDVAHGGLTWDGFQIIQWLHRIDEIKGVPIIVISGGEPDKYKQRSLAQGAVAFFHKPFNNDELLSTIEQALGSNANAGSPAAYPTSEDNRAT